MKIKNIFKYIPIPIIFTNFGMEKWQAGKSYGFFITVKPDYKYDAGLIEHELVHCKQHYRTFFLHGLMYQFSKSYREKCEIEAYSVQSVYKPEYISQFADFMATRYGLDHSAEHYKEILLRQKAKV